MIQLTSLIPPQYRLLAWLLAAGIALSAAAWGGAKVASWKAGSDRTSLVAEHAKAVTALKDRIAQVISERDQLALDITVQSMAVEQMAADSAIADKARRIAQERAQEATATAARRKAEIDAIKAADCSGAIDALWEIRK